MSQTIFDEKVKSLGMFDQELVSKNATCTSIGLVSISGARPGHFT